MRRRSLAYAAALAVLACAPALAQSPSSQMDAPPPAAYPGKILKAEDVDPRGLLPPPPAEGSAAQKAELAELHQIQDSRTPSEFALAEWDNIHEDPSAFAPTLGPKFDMAELPATARLLEIVEHEQSAAKKLAKAEFHRPRPWVVDSTVVGCDHSDDKPNTSYPSGHTTMAFTMAVVLSDLMPERSQDIFARASEYAHDRMVCGVHFRSDIVAGQAFGTAIGVQLVHAPELQGELEAARQELHAAGLAK
ncbi:phosphatase PAP2 family protein [Phenylobacterium sp.]|uniref:acid phosphatase n=1 Tax=Phenylobacterium sp. TaxID=1871053 RepID=UPI0035B30447